MDLLPLAFYVAAAVAYGVHFVRPERSRGSTATALLAAGVVAHTFVIGMRTVEVGHAPLAGTSSAVSAFVWLLAAAYLYLEIRTEERAMGVFIAALLAALQLVAAADRPAAEPRAAVLDSPLFLVHVLSLLFAYASFALAAVVGLTYVLLFKEIKAKHLGFFYRRLPSLQALDRMNARAVRVGWAFLTIGVAVGAAWAIEARRAAPADPRLQAMSLADPKIFVALVCWGVYSFHVVARRFGWSGRRAAWLSTIGFAVVLLNFVAVGYFLTRSHNF
ncbi:MAG TPA: cytochrome c biogenesis protein CcsA [Vicinamibacterales bacterium]|nr:cytochrome c biogenesis protein CcsA [Vicinamibacterales bacterium]